MEDSPSKKRRKATFKEVGPSLSKDELIRRLKNAAQGLRNVDQGEQTEDFDGFTASVASPFIFHHKDKDVKSFAACCFADILRIYAPEPPYNEDQLKDIFHLIISQLKGLENVNAPTYKRNFYILESLALVKTFNVCMELEATDIMHNMFKLFFSLISEQHDVRVKTFMLDVMAPIIQEEDSLPSEILETILLQLVSPRKTKKPQSYQLACDLLDRCSSSIEPYMQLFFNNALVLNGEVHKDLNGHLYDLMFELFKVNRTVLLSVLPQLEFKVKGNDETERIDAVKLLGKMFASEDCTLAQTNKQLWNCYIGRFCDISSEIRIECIKMSKAFLTSNIPLLKSDITEQISSRLQDMDEKVRLEALLIVYEAATDDFAALDEKLLEDLKERMRDKKWSIRREAITCIGKIYKKLSSSSKTKPLLRKIDWAPSKILHQYMITNMDDRLCIERVLHGCLVPVTLNIEERMERLFHVYTSLDDMGTILFDNMLQQRARINKDFTDLLTAIPDEEIDDREKLIHRLTIMIARALPDPIKTQEHLKKLIVLLSDKTTYKLFSESTDLKQDCTKIIKCVSEIVKKLSGKHPIIDTVKCLLDRACPMLVDQTSFVSLIRKMKNYFEGMADDEDDDLSEDELALKAKKCLKLIQVLVKVRPSIFQTKQAYETFLVFLKHNDPEIVQQSLNCLRHVLANIEEVDKSLSACFKPVLNKLVVTGSPKQSKYAVRCLLAMMKDSVVSLERLFTTLVDSLDEDETCYKLQTTLSALGEMAILAPEVFETKHKMIIRDFVVKKILVIDREKTSRKKEPDDEWGDESKVSEETTMKIEAIKLLVKWLLGLDSARTGDNALPVLRLLCTIINNDGDLSGDGKISAINRSRLRLKAGSGLLKLAQQTKYTDQITVEQYHQVALIMQDSCCEVRDFFTTKLHKGLETLRLPPSYMAIYALAAVDPSRERKQKVKQMIVKNSQTRRDYTKQHSSVASKPYAVLPEYSLPYLVHLLAHHPDFNHKDNESLLECKEYLWYFLEPILGSKAENYSFLKKLLENIKRTKDALAGDDQTVNEKLYAVCDLAIACIMQKTQTFTLKEFPGNLVLPKKLFIAEKNSAANSKSYLPKNFIFSPKKIKSTATANETKNVAVNQQKKSGKRPAKRSNPEEVVSSSDDDTPLSTPAKKRRAAAPSSKSKSSSKKKDESSTKKKTKVVSSNVQAAKRNLNGSPKKSAASPKKVTKTSPSKKDTKKSKENSSPRKVAKSIPKRASPKKRVTSPRKNGSTKQAKIDSFMNGHKSSSSEDEDEDSIVTASEESSQYTAINDERPARKRVTPSPSPSPKKNRRNTSKINSSPVKTLKERTVQEDEKPTPKLKIKRKPRATRR
ncbi:sister chromatid cohesion protein PDS5 homolog B-like [Clytia hemisphaerica]|uniref:Uncharacterized protein n=1 Tax=Clytia hemisphaerica TaxID=252671 RepID=A0A7M5URH2_9CNID